MLIDAFTFAGHAAELDLLEIRLNYLDSIVDYFVISESNKTQSSLDKPFNFEIHQERYKKFKDKIIYIKVEDNPNEPGSWAIENHQRNCLLRGLSKFKYDDLVLLSDLDEFPNRESVKDNILQYSLNMRTSSLLHSFHAYYLDLYSPNKRWIGTVLSNVNQLFKQSPQGLRNNKDYGHILEGKAGFHFSWLSGFEGLKTKFISCIEPFDKGDLKLDVIEKLYKHAATDGGYFITCENPYDSSIPLRKFPLTDLPSEILDNKNKYEHLLLP